MRERLIELIDACGKCDKHTEEKGCVGCEYEYFEDKCVNHLRGRMADDLLANDVVAVVRCKDCRHSEICPDRLLWCNEMERIVEQDGYCYKGERGEK